MILAIFFLLACERVSLCMENWRRGGRPYPSIYACGWGGGGGGGGVGGSHMILVCSVSETEVEHPLPHPARCLPVIFVIG